MDWDGAESDFKRHRAQAELCDRVSLYSILLRSGPFDELPWPPGGAELDPLSLIVNANLGDAYFFARRYDDAIRQHRAGRDLTRLSPTHLYLGMAFAQKWTDRLGAHRMPHRESLAGDGDFRPGWARVSWGERENAEAREVLASSRTKRGGAAVSFDVGLVQVGLGNRAAAIEWLGRACQDQPSGIKDLGVDPRLDPLRKDPGFEELLRRTRLDQNRM